VKPFDEWLDGLEDVQHNNDEDAPDPLDSGSAGTP
jgi:hypothetical protein